MKKIGSVLIGIVLAGAWGLPSAWSAAEEDWKELGIESKRGGPSVEETLGKAKAIDEKYERAKATVAAALTGTAIPAAGKAAKGESAPHEKPKPEKPAVAPRRTVPHADEQESFSSSRPRTDTLRLKNGQELSGVAIAETTGNGYWVEMEGGRIFFEKSEVAEVVKN